MPVFGKYHAPTMGAFFSQGRASVTDAPLFDLAGRTVVVTGGGKGIGKTYVAAFAHAGARVLAADIDAAAASGVAATLTAAGRTVWAVGVDIADPAPGEAMAAVALGRYGRTDVLVNNAS